MFAAIPVMIRSSTDAMPEPCVGPMVMTSPTDQPAAAGLSESVKVFSKGNRSSPETAVDAGVLVEPRTVKFPPFNTMIPYCAAKVPEERMSCAFTPWGIGEDSVPMSRCPPGLTTMSPATSVRLLLETRLKLSVPYTFTVEAVA